ncbi:reverse transcriptase domain-containing protein [Tanacetum coccineum]
MQEVVKKEIVKLLDTGIIYPIADSPWVSPIHCVPKKGGITVVTNKNDELVPTRTVTGWRVCIDYRKLNEATAKDHFPLPFMDQMLERLAGNKYFCFLDGFSGYFQIPIDPNDQEKTTFTCPFETYAYRRMPFGLCNAPATFQSIVKMLIFPKLGKVSLQWVKEGIVLGYKSSSAGLEVDKAKIDVILKLPPLTNIKGIRSFLGHVSFYRRFIKDFSKIARPLTKLLEKDIPFEFDDECKKAFELLKQKLTCDPVIKSKIEKGTENVAADHLSRIENDETSDDSEVDKIFPKETLMEINTKDEPCAYKTPTGTTPYKLIYGKNCHLPFKIEHRAYWALKNCNPDLIAAGEKRMFQLHELDELGHQAYENSRLYKERTKICLGVDLEADEWIKDFECSNHMTDNRKLFSNYKVYNKGNVIFGSNLHGNIIGKGQICDNKCRVTFSEHDSEITKDGKVIGYSQNSKAYIILNKHTRKVKESLNVTFDETPPPSKTSPLVDDDLDEEEAIKVTEKKNLESNIVDETLEIDEIVNIKESKNHPLENVIGNLNQRTLRSQAQNQSNFFCFISTIEQKNVNEALTDDSWIVAMQEELN